MEIAWKLLAPQEESLSQSPFPRGPGSGAVPLPRAGTRGFVPRGATAQRCAAQLRCCPRTVPAPPAAPAPPTPPPRPSIAAVKERGGSLRALRVYL